jgi:hypothetical protein
MILRINTVLNQTFSLLRKSTTKQKRTTEITSRGRVSQYFSALKRPVGRKKE